LCASYFVVVVTVLADETWLKHGRCQRRAVSMPHIAWQEVEAVGWLRGCVPSGKLVDMGARFDNAFSYRVRGRSGSSWGAGPVGTPGYEGDWGDLVSFLDDEERGNSAMLMASSFSEAKEVNQAVIGWIAAAFLAFVARGVNPARAAGLRGLLSSEKSYRCIVIQAQF
jgi:hypothetical protein